MAFYPTENGVTPYPPHTGQKVTVIAPTGREFHSGTVVKRYKRTARVGFADGGFANFKFCDLVQKLRA